MHLNGLKLANIIRVLSNYSDKSLMLHRHVCALILGGKIISIGINKDYNFKNSPLHAEINAFNNFKRNNTRLKILPRCTMIVLRVRNDGSLAYSKPCEKCINTIKQYNVKKIIYSCVNGTLKEETSNEITNHYKTLYFRTF